MCQFDFAYSKRSDLNAALEERKQIESEIKEHVAANRKLIEA